MSSWIVIVTYTNIKTAPKIRRFRKITCQGGVADRGYVIGERIYHTVVPIGSDVIWNYILNMFAPFGNIFQ